MPIIKIKFAYSREPVPVKYLYRLEVVTVHPDDGAADGLGRVDGQRQVLVSLVHISSVDKYC
jgi:hypothetical protein